MPNRILKESIRSSKSVNAVTDFQFRLWTYLITYVDDYGRGSADPQLLRGFLFPRRHTTEAAIAKGLAALETAGLLRLYQVRGERYLCFPRWGEHQRIQTKRSKFPAPEEDAPVGHGEFPCQSNPNPNPDPNPDPKETKEVFVPPSEEEVAAYCRERGSRVDPRSFVEYYGAREWKTGRSPMRDWRAALRSWERRQEERRLPF